MVKTHEIAQGIIGVTIRADAYGEAGAHWRGALSGPNHGGFGKIYIQRFGANKRRYWHCYDMAGYYHKSVGTNVDECPGAMFIWSTRRYPSVAAVDAIDNQALGRALGNALRRYPQKTEEELWEVRFLFV